jgi:predicted nucleic acid-binding protein
VSERWVINASPVILLSKAGLIDLLPKARSEMVIPSGVVAEVSTGSEGDAGCRWLSGRGAGFVLNAPPIPEELQEAEIGRGEAEVLAWALTHPGFRAVLDDRQGRYWANKLNVPMIGSLGVAVHLKRMGLIPVVRPVLEKIKTAGGFVSEKAIQAALIQAGEA